MPRGKPIVLDTVEFSTQKAAREHFSAMLNRYRPGERVNPDDATELASLLKRHNDYQSKVGVGITHFEVIPAEFATQCFAVVRSDGSKEDFSYQRCIDQRKT